MGRISYSSTLPYEILGSTRESQLEVQLCGSALVTQLPAVPRFDTSSLERTGSLTRSRAVEEDCKSSSAAKGHPRGRPRLTAQVASGDEPTGQNGHQRLVGADTRRPGTGAPPMLPAKRSRWLVQMGTTGGRYSPLQQVGPRIPVRRGSPWPAFVERGGRVIGLLTET